MVLESARGVLSNESEYVGEPSQVSVYTDTETTRVSDDSFEIMGRFPAEKEESDIEAPRDQIIVSVDSEVGREISEMFSLVRDKVSVSNGEITSIHLGPCREPSEEFEYPFYTTEDADYRFLIGVTDDSPPDSVVDESLSVGVSAFQELDESITQSQVVDMEFLFADCAVCELSSVRANLETAYPHRHFNVGSFDEYVEKRAEHDDVLTEEDLRSKGLHQVWSALPVGDDHKPPVGVCEQMEGLMWEYVTQSVQTDLEFMVECEAIQVRGGSYAVEGDMVKYYLFVPVVDGEIGVSR